MSTFSITLAPRDAKTSAAIAELIVRVYTKSGYVHPEHRKNRLTELQNWLQTTSTTTFVATVSGNIVGTISVFKDSAKGVPLEVVHGDAVDLLRVTAQSFVEVGQFAIDTEALSELKTGKSKISLSLIRTALQYCIASNIHSVCIANNPKHQGLYKCMGFKQIGEVRAYKSAEGAPAMFMVLPLGSLVDAQGNCQGTSLLRRLLQPESGPASLQFS